MKSIAIALFMMFTVNIIHSQEKHLEVSLIVTEASTKEALPFVNVILYESGVLYLGATTDMEGKAVIENVLPREYEMVISTIGFEEKRLSVKVLEGENLAISANKTRMERAVILCETVEVTAYQFECFKGFGCHRECDSGFNCYTLICCSRSCSYISPDSIAGPDEQYSIEETEESLVSIYPNPSTGLFNIQSDNALNSVDVYNMSGQMVFHKSDLLLNKRLDLSNLPPGNYFLHIDSMGERIIEKIVKL